MYPMLGTHPDLTYAIRALGQHTATPGEEHQQALDRVFRYLCTTKDWCLIYQHGTPESSTLTSYADANWANDLGDCKSTSSYIFKLAGGAISWSSKKQSSVALLSTEAKYIARAHATKELVWLQYLLGDIGMPDNSPTTLCIDNQSAITITKNPQFHNQTKHIEI